VEADWMEIVLVEMIARNVFLKFKCNELFSLINPLFQIERKYGQTSQIWMNYCGLDLDELL
jgi:hypothetical protein